MPVARYKCINCGAEEHFESDATKELPSNFKYTLKEGECEPECTVEKVWGSEVQGISLPK